MRQTGRKQEALQQQPFRNETRQWRQAGTGDHPGQGQPRHPGHAVNQSAELAQVALLGGMQHRAGAQEQEALEAGVGQAVVEHGGHGQCRQRLHAIGVEDQGQADAHRDEADVFDRRIRQQPLHVVLHRAVEHAEQCGDEAHYQSHHAPPPDRRMQQVEAHAQQAVDGRLQHHTAHHRRHRRRRRRVRLGQPDMQRHQAGLGAEAAQRQQEGGRGPEGRQLLGAHAGKTVVAASTTNSAGHDAKRKQDANGAEVRDQQVEETGAADFLLTMIGGDKEVGRQRHALPGHHEGVGIVGHQYHQHAGEKDVVFEAKQPERGAVCLAEIARRVNGNARRCKTKQQGEHGRKVVQPQVEGQIRQADHQHGCLRRAAESTQRHHADQHPDQCTEREQDLADDVGITRREQSEQPDGQPGAGGNQQEVDGQETGHVVTAKRGAILSARAAAKPPFRQRRRDAPPAGTLAFGGLTRSARKATSAWQASQPKRFTGKGRKGLATASSPRSAAQAWIASSAMSAVAKMCCCEM